MYVRHWDGISDIMFSDRKIVSKHPNRCNEAQLAACVVEYIAVYQYMAYVKCPNWHLCSLHPICLYIPLRQCLTGIPVVIYTYATHIT